MAKEARKAEIILEFQNVIEECPVTPQQAYAQACSNDKITIDSWRETWIRNIKANHAKFGSFKENGIGKLYGLYKNQPAIVIGSGPSLKYNASHLKKNDGIVTVSCLHNFHYLEDLGVGADYYVTLDAGPIVIEEVYEGGVKTPEEYWAMTQGKKLIAYIGTDPRLFEKWQGEVYFYNAPIPDETIETEIDKLEIFRSYVSNGGNVLGACMYIAKGFFGCNPIAFMGADFSFGYDKKFHAWDSKYDKSLGYVVKLVDVFGNKVLSWQSYANFKMWFEYIARMVPGIYINCSEGGTLGSYPEGNISAIKQMELEQFLGMYQLSKELESQSKSPEKLERKILF
jgi:hypothetical protein